MVSVPDAIRAVLRQTAFKLMSEPTTPESVDSWNWKELLGRRLAVDVIMSEPGYPAYSASIMDGYAIHTGDENFSITSDGDGWTHVVVDRVFAGDAAKQVLQTTTASSALLLPSAYYITTGAIIPENCNCVVPIEACKVSDDGSRISITTTMKPGTWIRPIGCDIAAGTVVLPKGHIMQPVSMGLLMQSGVETVQVQQKLRVGVLSTGNELLLQRQQQQPNDGQQNTATTATGKIPDANRPILLALLSTFGVEVIDLGIERDDDLEALTQTLRTAMDTCDIILTTDGISMGEPDVLEQVVVQQLGGNLYFGRLHMKPGKPTTFVTVPHEGKTKLFFCMPGNPVSATVCTQLLVKPCLQLWSDASMDDDTSVDQQPDNGNMFSIFANFNAMVDRMVQNAWVHPEVTCRLSPNMKLDKERPEYHRVIFSTEKEGKMLMATSTGVQRSSRLQSLRDADGLLVLPQGVDGHRMEVKAGEEFTVLLLKDDRGVQVGQSAHLNR